MAYQSLYRRYRPQRFDEVRGQQHLVTALRNAVREDRVGHAYLFSGPRGTGKTTAARILAKALNCTDLHDGEPCGTCESCRAIAEGSSFDVFELDAASNNGVDAIRDLVDRASQSSPGRRKVYILDEVHMLSAGASNALLKTLEEPPDHVVFVLATTDPQKVLPTIKSRVQHYDVHLLSADELTELVEHIIADAELDVPDGTVDHVLAAGGGSARDTISALEQIVAFGTLPDDLGVIDDLVEALCATDTGRALTAIERALRAGQAPRTLGESLMARLRDLFLASVGGDLSRLPEGDRARVTDQAERLGARGATHALEVLGDAFVGITDAPDPRIPLEVALVRLTRPELDVSPTALLGRIEALERRLAEGGAPAPAPDDRTVDAAPAGGDAPGRGPEAPATPTGASPAPADDGPPPSSSGGGDGAGLASAARQALAATRKGGGTDAPRRRPPEPPPAAPAPSPSPPSAVAPTPSASAPASEPGPDQAATDRPPPAGATPAGDPEPEGATSPAPTPSPASDLPTRDELVVAWGDHVLESLPQRAKVRFAGGRFIEVADGAAVFGLPNEHHLRRCEDVRSQVEEALAAHLGRPVPMRLVIDDDVEQPRRPGDARVDPAASLPEDHEVDVDELRDADGAAGNDVERISAVFPGTEVVEEDGP